VLTEGRSRTDVNLPTPRLNIGIHKLRTSDSDNQTQERYPLVPSYFGTVGGEGATPMSSRSHIDDLS
jgi:hypothetical protein